MAQLDRTVLAARLADFGREAKDRPELKQAAVAVVVTETQGRPALLLPVGRRDCERMRASGPCPGAGGMPGRPQSKERCVRSRRRSAWRSPPTRSWACSTTT